MRISRTGWYPQLGRRSAGFWLNQKTSAFLLWSGMYTICVCQHMYIDYWRIYAPLSLSEFWSIKIPRYLLTENLPLPWVQMMWWCDNDGVVASGKAKLNWFSVEASPYLTKKVPEICHAVFCMKTDTGQMLAESLDSPRKQAFSYYFLNQCGVWTVVLCVCLVCVLERGRCGYY